MRSVEACSVTGSSCDSGELKCLLIAVTRAPWPVPSGCERQQPGSRREEVRTYCGMSPPAGPLWRALLTQPLTAPLWGCSRLHSTRGHTKVS